MRDSEEKYRTLFDSMGQGFCTVQVLFDENNKPVDYAFLEINPAGEWMFVEERTGQPITEAVADFLIDLDRQPAT